MSGHDRWGAFFFRHRLAVMVAAFSLAVLSAIAADRLGPAPWSSGGFALFATLPQLLGPGREGTVLVLSGLVALAAFLLRTSAEARLREDVYGQGGSRRLVIEGPFEWVRNPLYVGTFSFIAAVEILWTPFVIWAVLSGAFFFVLDRMVRYEEGLLSVQFGATYREYQDRVPRWRPARPEKPLGARRPSASSYLFAALGNLGLLSLGAYRVAIALGAPVAVAGWLQLAALLVWLAVLGQRRLRHSSGSALDRSISPSR